MSEVNEIVCSDLVEQVSVLEDYAAAAPAASGSRPGSSPADDVSMLKNRLEQDCRLFKRLAEDIQKISADLLERNKEEIISLAVKIAAKITAVELSRDNYNLSWIITDALNHTPGGEGITFFLNVDDFKRLGELQKSGEIWEFPGVKFMADNSLHKAQCRVESSKGFVCYKTDEILEKIEKALCRIV